MIVVLCIYSPSVASRNRKRLESIEEVKAPLPPPPHVRNPSDISLLSNGSWFSGTTRDSPMSQSQLERIALFEKQQQDQFDRTKHDIGQKLSHALDQNIRNVKTTNLISVRSIVCLCYY